MFNFEDRVAIVTGAAGNLGGVLAHALNKAGARLSLIDLYPDRLRETCGDIAESDRHRLIGSIDLTSESSVDGAVAETIQAFDRIDMLFNVAGGYRAGNPVSETSIEEWDLMLNLNARSVFLVSRAVLPHMLKRGTGHIVNFGARPGLKGVADAAAYSAAKSVVLRLTESMSAELKRKGIHVNAVIPGRLDTPENREEKPKANPSDWVSLQAICDVIMFLASDAAQAVHGAIIPVYGTG